VKKVLAVGILGFALLFPYGPSASAASSNISKPTVVWKCKLSRILDHRGMVVFFNPTATVSWYGKKGFYKFYDTTDKTKPLTENLIGNGVVLGADKKVNSASIYLGRKFQDFLSAKHLSLLVVVSDLKNETSQASCEWNGPAASGL